MVQTPVQALTLNTFLQLPETQPASEFINCQLIQKPMPQGEHSVLQSEIVNAINAAGKSTQQAYVFPELRCVFGEAALTRVADRSRLRYRLDPILRLSHQVIQKQPFITCSVLVDATVVCR